MTTEQQTTIERGVADSEGRVPSTEERVSYIEGALPELARRSDMAGIRVELAEFRTESRTELAGVKVELAEFKTEMRTELADVRTELAEFRTESRTELAGVKVELAEFKTEMRTELADVKADVAVLDTRLDRVEQDVKDLKVSVDNLEIAVSKMETRLVRWMIGIGALVVGAIAASQILFN